MIPDQFGNYVVQHIVKFDEEGEGKQRVLMLVSRGLEAYSKHKFASNVVEKCIQKSDDVWRREVVAALNYNPLRPESEDMLVRLIKDNYGNYVVRTFTPPPLLSPPVLCPKS
ncbi:hypothetical protein MRB53_040741 [Persea americana]|nr:hypothetical protein MRB53_040741 [Persea americana]